LLTHLKHAVSGNPIYELGYGYDAVGNRVYKEDLVNSTRSEFYDYDHQNRLRRFRRGTLNANKDDFTEVAHP